MKKITVGLLILAMVFALAACGGMGTKVEPPPPESSLPLQSPQESGEGTGNSRILIAYFSRANENIGVGVVEKGNTEIVAEIIAAQTGGLLFRIETETPYPEKYDDCTDVAQQEKSENARPKLTRNIENIDDYDVIFIGYPIWWGDMPMPVYTFLESHDFAGKTIVPFCTHEGSGISNTEQSIADTCPATKLLDGFAIKGKTAQESKEETIAAVANWLRENEFVL